MATTVGQVLESLLLYFSPEERSIPSSADYPGRCEEAVRAVNAAVQDMAAIASSVFSGEEKGFTTRSSVTVTLSATNGSTTATITGLGTVEPALCLLDASGVQARVEQVVSVNLQAVASVRLLDQWPGTTGTHAATLYGDSISLGSLQMTGSPWIADIGNLTVCATETSAQQTGFAYTESRDFGRERLFFGGSGRTTGNPVACWVHTLWNPVDPDRYGGTSARFLVLHPAPESLLSVFVPVTAVPSSIDTAAPDTDAVIPVPQDWCESILIPMAARRLMRSPFFRNDSARKEIIEQDAAARHMLVTLRPSRMDTIQFIPAP